MLNVLNCRLYKQTFEISSFGQMFLIRYYDWVFTTLAAFLLDHRSACHDEITITRGLEIPKNKLISGVNMHIRSCGSDTGGQILP